MQAPLVERVLAELVRAEAREVNPHFRDDYRIARLTVAYAASGEYQLCSPHVAASYAVLGLHPDKVWPAMVARLKALCGAAYGRLTDPTDRIEEIGAQKKPPGSVHFEWEERLKKASGAELRIPRPFGTVEPLLMAATAPEYRESGRQNSEKDRLFFRQEKLAEMIAALPIKPNLARSFEAWWRVCTAPHGSEIQLFKELKAHARAARISERTARYHRRAFENLQLVEVAHTANSKFRRPTTHRVKLETLAQRPWTTCPSCGHRHQVADHCGCEVKYGTGHRICRCEPFHKAPTPIRPQRASYRPSPPAQERAASPAQPSAPAAPVAVASREHRAAELGSRSSQRIRQLRLEFTAKMGELMRGIDHIIEKHSGLKVQLYPGDRDYLPPVPWTRAFTMTCQFLGLSESEGQQLLKQIPADSLPQQGSAGKSDAPLTTPPKGDSS